MGGGKTSRRLRPDPSENTEHGQRHATTALAQNRTPPIISYDGRASHLEMLTRIKYARRLINTEIYPFARRACIAIDAIRKCRIG